MTDPIISQDVRRLVDLLALLPRMQTDEENPWWRDYVEAHGSPWDWEYYCRSLVPFCRYVAGGSTDPEDLMRLAGYCLMFFSVADRPDCWRRLDMVAGQASAYPSGSIGRRWAENVCDLALRVFAQASQATRSARPPWD